MITVFFCAGPVTSYETAKRSDVKAFGRFFHAMLDRGVYLPPSAYEGWFLSSAHDAAALATILDALPHAAAAAREAARG
jgi:glutamate-1-semialdehyde 2,1-aminomutase